MLLLNIKFKSIWYKNKYKNKSVWSFFTKLIFYIFSNRLSIPLSCQDDEVLRWRIFLHKLPVIYSSSWPVNVKQDVSAKTWNMGKLTYWYKVCLNIAISSSCREPLREFIQWKHFITLYCNRKLVKMLFHCSRRLVVQLAVTQPTDPKVVGSVPPGTNICVHEHEWEFFIVLIIMFRKKMYL